MVGGRDIRARDGACYDCTDLAGATDCGAEGALACETGYYLATDAAGKQTCERCGTALDHCVECSDQDTCTKCSSSFFRLTEDGKCACKGGEHAVYKEAEGGCGCAHDA